MKKLLIFTFVIFLITGCTKLGEPTMHPSDWTDPNSEDSHIAKIIVTSSETCGSCHGQNYDGGSSGVSCYKCHAGGQSGHPAYNIWIGSPNSPDFHGKDETERCITCHGDDYLGGTSGVSCYQCHNGPNAYSCQDFTAPATHTILNEKDDCEALHMPGFNEPLGNGCTTCHGTDLTGSYGPSCFTCHGNRWDQ